MQHLDVPGNPDKHYVYESRGALEKDANGLWRGQILCRIVEPEPAMIIIVACATPEELMARLAIMAAIKKIFGLGAV